MKKILLPRLTPFAKNLLGNVLFLLGILLLLEYPILVGIALGHVTWTFLAKSLLVLLPVATLVLTLTKRPLIILALVLITSCLAIETSMMVMYGEFLASGNIISVLNTTSAEAGDFLSVSVYTLWYWIPLILLAIVLIVALKRIQPLFYWHLSWTVLLIIANVIAIEVNKKTHSAMGEVTRRLYITEAILCYPPYNTLNQIHITAKKYRRQKMADPNFSYGAVKVDAQAPQKEIYVLAIGESLRYRNFSLNGQYERTTTPFLEKTENLLLYNDYYSPACLTAFSVPIMMTRATVHNFELNFQEPGIVKPFQEAGFKTFVVANKYNTIAEEKYLTAGCDTMVLVEQDRYIPGEVKKLLQTEDKIFFILHFWGNHLLYVNYDPEFDVYQPSVYKMENPPFNNKELNTNSYDNTILFTDYLLHNIISDLDSLNVVSTLLFTPDHGENISDVAIGHGYSNHPPKDEYHIPLVIWYSDEWKQTYPDKLAHLFQHQNDPINGENIFYSTYDMANIVINAPYHHPEWSIFNDSLALRERYLMMRDGVNIMKAE